MTRTTTTRLHLAVPRGGGGVNVVSAAASSAVSGIASLCSTPSGTFNLALAILGGSTAMLRLYDARGKGGKGNDDGGGDGGGVVRRDANVVSLQRRFLAVFWLLRMADWLQVREYEGRRVHHIVEREREREKERERLG
jgi:hypothetical protein